MASAESKLFNNRLLSFTGNVTKRNNSKHFDVRLYEKRLFERLLCGKSFFFISSLSGFVSKYNSTHLFSVSLSAVPRQNCLLLNGLMSRTYITVNPRNRVLLEKLEVPQLSEFILRSPNVHYRIHNSPSVLRIPNKMNPIHALQTHLLKIHLTTFSYLRLDLPNGVPFRPPPKTQYAFLFSSTLTTRASHLKFLDVITLIIFLEKYKRCSP